MRAPRVVPFPGRNGVGTWFGRWACPLWSIYPIKARGFFSVKMKILAATGIVAVLLAASGVAMAVSRSTAPHTAANACVTSNGQLKLVQNGSWWLALVNVTVSVLGGFVAVALAYGLSARQ